MNTNKSERGLACAVLLKAIQDALLDLDTPIKSEAIMFIEGQSKDFRTIRNFWCDVAGYSPYMLKKAFRRKEKENNEIKDMCKDFVMQQDGIGINEKIKNALSNIKKYKNIRDVDYFKKCKGTLTRVRSLIKLARIL